MPYLFILTAHIGTLYAFTTVYRNKHETGWTVQNRYSVPCKRFSADAENQQGKNRQKWNWNGTSKGLFTARRTVRSLSKMNNRTWSGACMKLSTVFTRTSRLLRKQHREVLRNNAIIKCTALVLSYPKDSNAGAFFLCLK